MNNKDNLQKAFEKAFEEHQEPLHQAQWDRLDAALDRKKSKFRFLPWLFSIIAVAVLAVSLGYWLGNANNDKDIAINKTHETRVAQKSQLATSDIITKEQNNSSTDNKKLTTDINSEINQNKTITHNQTQLPTQTRFNDLKPRATKYTKNKTVNIDNSNGNQFAGNSSDDYNQKDKLETSEINEQSTAENSLPKINNNTKDKKESNEVDAKTINSDSALSAVETKDTTINNKTKEQNPPPPPHKNSWFALGLSSGISNAIYKNTEFTNPENMHKDTRQLYDDNTKETSSLFFNLFFDFKLIKNINLSINSGIQYRELKTEENVNYRLTEIAFRDTNGSINFYITDTSKNPLPFNNTSIKSAKYISIPLTANYTFPFLGKNELQLNGGIIANKLINASGTTFSINEGTNVNYKDKLSKKLTFGYIAGINYYRNIYKPIWLGIGYQVQQNQLQLSTEYGYIRSRINITNYTFNIKYKF